MFQPLVARTARSICFCALFSIAAGFAGFASAGQPKTSEAKRGFEQVDLFDAIRDKQVEVTVIPKNATRLTVQVCNTTKRPLALRLPRVFAALPIHAQFAAPRGGNAIFGGGPVGGGRGLGLGPGGGGGGGQPQGLGGGFQNQGMNGGNNLGFPGGGGNMMNGGGGFFNVPPEKTLKKRLDTVCLEFGKPDPHAKHRYRLAPLTRVSDNPQVAELMQLLASGRFDSKTIQLAAWRLASGKTWAELANLKHVRANGQRVPRYSTVELMLAKRVVDRLPSARRRRADRAKSLAAEE